MGSRMAFTNPEPAEITPLLREARTIAVVGLSDNPQRASYEVSATLLDYGYRIIPVNPALAVWEGIRAIPDLDHLPDVLGPGEQVDIVDVFRQPRYVAEVIDDCIRLQLPTVWLQVGVIDEAAAQRAKDAGLTVVMDRCMKTERMRLG
jgi:predicted CoA-binding protein